MHLKPVLSFRFCHLQDPNLLDYSKKSSVVSMLQETIISLGSFSSAPFDGRNLSSPTGCAAGPTNFC
jgi:hypothetical protein